MTLTENSRLTVLGAGSWGTALACVASRGGPVTLWGRDADVIGVLRAAGTNNRYLPGIRLSAAVTATTEMSAAVEECEAILLVVPSGAMASLADALASIPTEPTPLVICAKGLERNRAEILSEVIAEILPDHPLAVLSGPTFALEVARGLPTAVTIASEDAGPDPERSLAARLARRLGGPNFRPYISDDVIGVEVAGAIKNVLAIACGIAQGRKLGANAGATLLTRGLAELARLTAARGGKSETVMGPAGLGDLALTCSNTTSRNMRFGIAIGSGTAPRDALEASDQVIEGYHNAETVRRMARRLGVDLPICFAVHAVLHEGQPLDDAISGLLSRPFKMESGGELP